MVDFKPLLEKLQRDQGFCSLLDESYATIDGTRTHCVTGEENPVKVHWVCSWDKEGNPSLELLDGVTGFEKWYIKDLIENPNFFNPNALCFSACAGTPNRWDSLYLDIYQLREVVTLLYSLHCKDTTPTH